MDTGGTYIPDALKQTSAAMIVSYSAEDRQCAPTSLPFAKIILDYDLETAEMPVSSQL
jgi:hypothetical protein